MTALEIFLLIIGVVLIFGSFFLTDKKTIIQYNRQEKLMWRLHRHRSTR